MRLHYHVLDVFTDTRFGGNPLAVVLDADGLDPARMQVIAREFNLSETVFDLQPSNEAHTARVRIFTPAAELPFAGHPTVGTAALLAEIKYAALPLPSDALIVLEAPIGILRVGVRLGLAPFAEFDAPKLPEDMGGTPPLETMAAALGLIPSEIGFENHRPTHYTAGLPFFFVPVRDRDAIGRAAPALAHWDDVFGDRGAVYAYCRETVHTTASFHARMFDPGHGILEDPATGSAAAAFAGPIHRFDALPDGLHKRIIEQGYEMGRPSTITLSLTIDGGKLDTVRVGGNAVRVASGQIEV